MMLLLLLCCAVLACLLTRPVFACDLEESAQFFITFPLNHSINITTLRPTVPQPVPRQTVITSFVPDFESKHIYLDSRDPSTVILKCPGRYRISYRFEVRLVPIDVLFNDTIAFATSFLFANNKHVIPQSAYYGSCTIFLGNPPNSTMEPFPTAIDRYQPNVFFQKEFRHPTALSLFLTTPIVGLQAPQLGNPFPVAPPNITVSPPGIFPPIMVPIPGVLEIVFLK